MSSPTANWNVTTINGKQFLVIDVAQFRVPVDYDPSSGLFIAVAAPNALAVGNLPFLLRGEPGTAATFDTTIDFTALAPTDTTPDSASLVALGSNAYQLVLALHRGQAGADGAALLDPTDYGTPLYKQILQINAAADGFEYTSQKIGDRFFPGSIASCPSGNPAYTLASVSIPAQTFDWRPHIEGHTVITGTGPDLQVDLLARLSNVGGTGETAGNVVARATQPAGQYPSTHQFTSAAPPGSADSYDKVLAGATAIVYMRVERQSGTATFTTSNSTSLFSVRPMAVP